MSQIPFGINMQIRQQKGTINKIVYTHTHLWLDIL